MLDVHAAWCAGGCGVVRRRELAPRGARAVAVDAIAVARAVGLIEAAPGAVCAASVSKEILAHRAYDAVQGGFQRLLLLAVRRIVITVWNAC